MVNVAIVAGGDSGEYAISIKSGKQVELHMDQTRFRPFLIEIRGNKWFYRAGMKKFPVDKNDFSLQIGRRRIRFDAVFMAIHGTPGENGLGSLLSGYTEQSNVSVVEEMVNMIISQRAYEACGFHAAYPKVEMARG